MGIGEGLGLGDGEGLGLGDGEGLGFGEGDGFGVGEGFCLEKQGPLMHLTPQYFSPVPQVPCTWQLARAAHVFRREAWKAAPAVRKAAAHHMVLMKVLTQCLQKVHQQAPALLRMLGSTGRRPAGTAHLELSALAHPFGTAVLGIPAQLAIAARPTRPAGLAALGPCRGSMVYQRIASG